MLRLAGLRLSPLARIGAGAGLAFVGYALSAPLVMLVGGGVAVAGIVSSITPKDPETSDRA